MLLPKNCLEVPILQEGTCFDLTSLDGAAPPYRAYFGSVEEHPANWTARNFIFVNFAEGPYFWLRGR